MRRWGASVAALVCAAATSLGCGRDAADRGTPVRVDVRGIQTRVVAARGRPLLLSFWATWCEPCIEELPGLVALHRDQRAGARVVAVSLDGFLSGDATSLQVVADFLRTTPVPVEHLVYAGPQGDLFRVFDLPGSIPYSILYDAGGRVVRRFEGPASPAAVRAALAAPRDN